MENKKLEKKSLYFRIGLLILAIVILMLVVKFLNKDTDSENQEKNAQISEESLKEMTTEELFEICLNYPNYMEYLYGSGDSPYEGFLELVKEYNGLQALTEREDAGAVVLSYYENIDIKDWKKEEKSYATKMRYLEYILGQKEVLQRLSVEERTGLFELCRENLSERKKKYPKVFHEEPTKKIMQNIYLLDSDEGIYEEVTGGAIIISK